MTSRGKPNPTESQNSELEDESLPNSQGKYLRINQSRFKIGLNSELKSTSVDNRFKFFYMRHYKLQVHFYH